MTQFPRRSQSCNTMSQSQKDIDCMTPLSEVAEQLNSGGGARGGSLMGAVSVAQDEDVQEVEGRRGRRLCEHIQYNHTRKNGYDDTFYFMCIRPQFNKELKCR